MQATIDPPKSSVYPSIGAANPPLIRDFPPGTAAGAPVRLWCGSLSNAELMAILLRTGLKGENVLAFSHRLLAEFKGLDGIARASYDDLCEQRGISLAKACQTTCRNRTGTTCSFSDPRQLHKINVPADIASLLSAEMAYLPREELRVVLMNIKHQVVGIEELYSGSVNSALVRPAEVFGSAVKKNCPAIAVVHNHPSGDPTPSDEDIETTAKLVEWGRLLEIDLVDHVVIGHGKIRIHAGTRSRFQVSPGRQPAAATTCREWALATVEVCRPVLLSQYVISVNRTPAGALR